jgi:uncharacterized membrane protein YdbT with pleckstrin-like domain
MKEENIQVVVKPSIKKFWVLLIFYIAIVYGIYKEPRVARYITGIFTELDKVKSFHSFTGAVMQKPEMYASLFIGLFFIFPIIGVFARRAIERLIVTDDAVYYKYAFINSMHKYVPAEAIRTVDVEQDLWGRLLNVGRIKIGTAATRGWEIIMDNIDAPAKQQEEISSVLNALQSADYYNYDVNRND